MLKRIGMTAKQRPCVSVFEALRRSLYCVNHIRNSTLQNEVQPTTIDMTT